MAEITSIEWAIQFRFGFSRNRPVIGRHSPNGGLSWDGDMNLRWQFVGDPEGPWDLLTNSRTKILRERAQSLAAASSSTTRGPRLRRRTPRTFEEFDPIRSWRDNVGPDSQVNWDPDWEEKIAVWERGWERGRYGPRTVTGKMRALAAERGDQAEQEGYWNGIDEIDFGSEKVHVSHRVRMVQVDNYEPKRVIRTTNWGWELYNHYATYRSGWASRQSRPADPAPESDSDAEDINSTFDLSTYGQDVTQMDEMDEEDVWGMLMEFAPSAEGPLPSFGVGLANEGVTPSSENDDYVEVLDGGVRTATFLGDQVEDEGLPEYPDLQRFQLLKKMGEGAFSNVYKAKDLQTNKLVAVKAVRKTELTANQACLLRANVLKEVQLLRTLKHDNIIRLLGFHDTMTSVTTPGVGKESGYYYLILELMPGGELFHELVRQTCLSEDESRRIITMVASAVRYLHEDSGVVHRDIKLENLLFDFPRRSGVPLARKSNETPKGALGCKDVDRIGTVKLADFGLSKVGYTAPEIVRDEWYSKGVDMWALGCVLYTLLCGFPPFYDEKVDVLTQKVAHGQFTFLSPWWDPVSHEAKDLVTRCLTVDPSRRYTIRQFLAHPWIRKQRLPVASDPLLSVPPAVRRMWVHSLSRAPNDMQGQSPPFSSNLTTLNPSHGMDDEVPTVGWTGAARNGPPVLHTPAEEKEVRTHLQHEESGHNVVMEAPEILPTPTEYAYLSSDDDLFEDDDSMDFDDNAGTEDKRKRKGKEYFAYGEAAKCTQERADQIEGNEMRTTTETIGMGSRVGERTNPNESQQRLVERDPSEVDDSITAATPAPAGMMIDYNMLVEDKESLAREGSTLRDHPRIQQHNAVTPLPTPLTKSVIDVQYSIAKSIMDAMSPWDAVAAPAEVSAANLNGGPMAGLKTGHEINRALEPSQKGVSAAMKMYQPHSGARSRAHDLPPSTIGGGGRGAAKHHIGPSNLSKPPQQLASPARRVDPSEFELKIGDSTLMKRRMEKVVLETEKLSEADNKSDEI
ncbi:hypothetical protein HDU93_008451 [Gonapodya sp. JEL0774]|nr:hypothetical protein HDU93_008451 [Gonapodya sp. JEL0774]